MAKEEGEKTKEAILSSGIMVKPVYGPEDIRDLDYARDLGDPGQYPFTRGIHPLMYRERPFTMRQYAGCRQKDFLGLSALDTIQCTFHSGRIPLHSYVSLWPR